MENVELHGRLIFSCGARSLDDIVTSGLCDITSRHSSRHTSRTDEPLLGELEREAARDLFQLVLRVLERVDADTGLSAA